MLIPTRARLSADFMRERHARLARQNRDRQAARRQSINWLAGSRRLRITIAIVALFVIGVVFPIWHKAGETAPSPKEESKEARALRNLWILRTALECFRHDCGQYPCAAHGLAALELDLGTAGWKGPYITALKLDPWRHAYRYAVTNEQVSLASAGPDGLEGPAADIPAPAPDYTVIDWLDSTNARTPPAANAEELPVHLNR